MSLRTRWQKSSGVFKDLLAGAWLSGDPEAGFRVVDRLLRGWCFASALVATLTLTPASSSGQTTFQGLGDLPGGASLSRPVAVSQDGSTVVGQSESANGLEAFRWTLGDGMSGLGDLPGGTFESLAWDVSGDGSIIVGTSHSGKVDCPGRSDEAFLWTEADGIVGLGDLPEGCFVSAAYGISADGEWIVGIAENEVVNTAAYWSPDTQAWTDMGFSTGPGNSSNVAAATPDRSWLVGIHRLEATPSYQAFRWSEASGEEPLGDLAGGDTLAGSWAVSDDGGVVVGFGTSASGPEGFRWTPSSGMTALGDLPGGSFESTAFAIAPDGSWIVGYGTSESGQEAVIWDSTHNLSRFPDFLSARGVSIPLGWTLQAATGIAVNGGEMTFVGYGLNPSGDIEGWIASVPCPDYLDLRAGNVDTGGGGLPVDVILVNGGSGDPVERKVSVTAGAATTLHVAKAPSLGGKGGYGIWIYDDEQFGCEPIQMLTGKGILYTLGEANQCFPVNNTVSAGSCPCPVTFPVGRTSKSLGSGKAGTLCLNKKPGYPKSPTDFTIAYPAGTFAVYGLHQDLNSVNSPAKNVSVGNTIVVVSQ